MGSILGLGRSPGRGHGHPFQHSCLENPKDRGAWQATVNRGTQSRTWLKQLSTCTHTFESKLSLTSSSLLLVKTSWGVVFSNGVISDFWHSVAFSSVPQSCPTLCHPMDCSTPGFPVHCQLPELAQTHVHWVSDAVQPSHRLLLLPPSILPHIRVFSNESVLHIGWPKCWRFSFSISPFNEYSGLISFRIDWLDLLTAQASLKSLPQHHSSKASIL